MKNQIKGNFDVLIEQKNTEEPSRLFGCEKIELLNNHLMIYKNKKLIFKVWLKKEYKDIQEALKNVGIKVLETILK